MLEIMQYCHEYIKRILFAFDEKKTLKVYRFRILRTMRQKNKIHKCLLSETGFFLLKYLLGVHWVGEGVVQDETYIRHPH
jgi:hypothetical protein